MRRFLLASCLILAAGPAFAARDPAPVPGDKRIRTIAYDRNNVTVVLGTVGATQVLEFPDDEKVEDVALSDSKFLEKATKGENLVYLKPKTAEKAQPVIIKTRLPTGKVKVYVLQYEAQGEGDAYFLVRFTDPARVQAARAAAAAAREREEQARAAEDALKRPAPPQQAPVNTSYSVQGSAQ